ncbi:geranylgeranylglycerol-phosphate geranylgeranyltransferase [Mesonia aestuariivivens]|uniref:geranylgeranylglycerol-phosphate geranylgeranyltransferase n=1 Tax=Mesonia aestuariivivens TaxID=2796128 RepID=UPI0021057B70|nr:geranylgeranylglycerol-phosphate geranylgeranyltransferase [Mesonia aestuariivivens]
MGILSRKNKLVLLKLASLFSVVRGYNILIIFIAQYLASIYILAPERTVSEILFDVNLFVIVIASTFAIASGYLINNFYDTEKDLINRPQKTLLDNYISQKTKLAIYFTLNFLTVILASYVSFKTVIFFSIFIFLLWFYSHKLKKYPFIGTLTASILAITPFFVVFVYYQNFDMAVFVHATFLFLIISIRELTKDLENLKGDLTQDYRTIPVVYGIKFSKTLISILVALTLVPTLILMSNQFEIGQMHYYFVLSFILMIIFLFFLWKSSSKLQYTLLHNLLKLIIVIGVFSILLIDIDVVLNRVL